MERLAGWLGLVGVVLLGTAAWGDEVAPVVAPPKSTADAPANSDAWDWIDVAELTIEGIGWPERSTPFGRLPANARDRLSASAWSAGNAPAGITARFETDANEILVRWSLTPAAAGIPESTARLAGGLDLYVRDGQLGWRWLSGATPSAAAEDQLAALVVGLPEGKSEYMLCLPALRGLRKLELGIPGNAEVTPAPALTGGREYPILLYGGAAFQGAGASRPGSALGPRLRRRMARDVVNIGLFGAGGVDMAAGAMLSEVNAAAIVIDIVGQCDVGTIDEYLGTFVQSLRAARPRMQILLVKGTRPAAAAVLPALDAEWEARRTALVKSYERMQAQGVTDIFLLENPDPTGADGEGSSDGLLPNDLGHARWAECLEGALKPLMVRWEEQRPGR
ncbi:SGNH/GDSL hydrolase family protein [Engelhardtia mirabilis]|uniref:SGNH hydrolase-type esterase domain-containing protein n=1 Tax=Engelhardtia mirabilis TaxID=2528011 RepID=A0A518BJJ9_9BACT|nr:hypothetical protein Pla133_21910 [Planctomycetes bacterium Pla133]QDV01440.1 hypothetical protein Pla86_21910 [Planctomycetes bacterium Pla86]